MFHDCEVSKKARDEKPCSLVLDFRLDLLWGPIADKDDAVYCHRLLPIEVRDSFVIDFPASPLIARGPWDEGGRGGGGRVEGGEGGGPHPPKCFPR